MNPAVPTPVGRASALPRRPQPLPPPITSGPLTALAPMQDVTDLPFMRVIAHYGAPDYYFTEFFRVHAQSRPERHIVRSLVENRTGRPIFAQLIGENIPDMVRTVRELLQYPIAGIDLNMGCPAPKVYKKNVGGGLLRDPDKIDSLLGALRDCVPGLFTVKMRIGFDTTEHFDRVLGLVNKHAVDLLSVHGRTVKEGYRSTVHYDFIAAAVRAVRCPVLANGNITSAARAAAVLRDTGAAGAMMGRHAIRNPWIFRQIRELHRDGTASRVTLAQVREYIARLYQETRSDDFPETAHVNKMKKYLNFVGQSVDADGSFLHDMRRCSSEHELFSVCDRHLLREPEREFSPEPYPGVIARPNCETPDAVDGCSLATISA